MTCIGWPESQNDRWAEYVASHAGLLSGKANSGRNGIFKRISEHARKRNTNLSLYEDWCWWRIMKIEKMIKILGQQLQQAAPPWELACMHLHMVGWVFGPCWVPHTYLGSSPWSLLGALHMVGVFSLAGVTNLPNCLLANTARLRTARRDQSCAKLPIMLWIHFQVHRQELTESCNKLF